MIAIPQHASPVPVLCHSGAWLKYKLNRSQEFVIGGCTAGNPFDALIMGCYEGAQFKFVPKVRNGFVSHTGCALLPDVAGTADGEMSLC